MSGPLSGVKIVDIATVDEVSAMLASGATGAPGA